MGMHPYGKPRTSTRSTRSSTSPRTAACGTTCGYFAYHYSRDTTLRTTFGEHFGRPPRDPEARRQVARSVLLRHGGEHPGGDRGDPAQDGAATCTQVTGMKNLCLAGGVALNSVANYKILRQGPFEDIYIHPAPGDDGGSVGAALLGLQPPARPAARPGARPRLPRQRVLRRRDRGLPAQVRHPVREDRRRREVLRLRRASSSSTARSAAGSAGASSGARARSARARSSPTRASAEMKEKLNATIKFREAFRPFAPSVLEERADEFFDIPEAERHFPARFMLYVAPVRDEKRSRAPGDHARGRLGPPADGLQGRRTPPTTA